MTLADKVTHCHWFCKLCRWFTSTKDTQKERVGVNQQCKLQWKQWLKETKCPMFMRAAAAKFYIPYPTLHKHIIKGSATQLLGRFRRTFSNDQESELVCITRPVSCLWLWLSLWHGWSSYCICLTVYSQRSLFVDQSSTGLSRSPGIARRLSASPVTCRPSLLLSPAACPKPAFWDPCSFFYILLISQKLHCAVVWTFIHMPPFVRPLWCSELCSWGTETSGLYRWTRRLSIILLYPPPPAGGRLLESKITDKLRQRLQNGFQPTCSREP